jgi:hypothetical protein
LAPNEPKKSQIQQVWGDVGGFEYEGRDQAEVNRHPQILIDEDYLEGKWIGDHQNFPCAFRVTDLTYRGHQFLANAKSEPLWQKALSSIRGSGKTMSIAVIEAVLVKLARG